MGVYDTDTSSTGTASSTIYDSFTFRFNVPPPPRPTHRCLHYLFALPCNAPKGDFRRAYRRLAKIAHPDLNPGRREEMGRWMVVLNRVYEALEKAA